MKGSAIGESDGISGLPRALANGGGGVVNPCPTAEGQRRRSAEDNHDGGVAAYEMRYVDGVIFSLEGVVGALLTGDGEVDVS